MPEDVVKVNRAPVLALWGAVVAWRTGCDWDESLTLGKAVSGLNAQAKGRLLGIFGPPRGPEPGTPPKKVGLGEEFWVDLLGRQVPAKRTEQGVRAVVKDEPIKPDSVRKYLESKLGDAYPAVRDAMTELAQAYAPDRLGQVAYQLYEKFRPKIESGQRGWGQKGELDLGLIRSLAEKARGHTGE